METSRFSPEPTAEEAAAAVAAIERFLGDTAPASTPTAVHEDASPWRLAALAEGVARAPQRPVRWQ